MLPERIIDRQLRYCYSYDEARSYVRDLLFKGGYDWKTINEYIYGEKKSVCPYGIVSDCEYDEIGCIIEEGYVVYLK